MDIEEVERVTRNMIENSYKEEAMVEVEEITEWPNDFADEVATVKIIGVPGDVKLSNNRWHEGNGYEIEFNQYNPNLEDERYGEVNYSEYKVKKRGYSLFLRITIPK